MIIYGPEDKLPIELQKLADAARRATEMSYAPYSDYKVGAAIQTESGEIHVGSNQENASFPLCMCAERVALYHYTSLTNQSKISGFGVFAHSSSASPDLPPSPCGACRQVMAEFQSRQEKSYFLLLTNQNGYAWYFDSISELLPYAFDPQNLMI